MAEVPIGHTRYPASIRRLGTRANGRRTRQTDRSMRSQQSDTITVIGGSSFVRTPGVPTTVTWPMMALTFNGDEIGVRFRAQWIKALARAASFGKPMGSSPQDPLLLWSARCDEVSLLRVSQARGFSVGSLIMRSPRGDVSFGVSPLSGAVPRRHLRTVADELERRGTVVEMADSNFRARWNMKPLSDEDE